MTDPLITVAIHTLRCACALKDLLEREGVKVTLQNVNLCNPDVAAGVRVRIHESDLPVALRIIENPEIFSQPVADDEHTHAFLVPIDFSEHSDTACFTAFRLAHVHNAELVLLHSFLDPIYSKRSQLNDALTFDNDQNHDDATNREIASAEEKMRELEARIVQKIKAGEIPPAKFSHRITEGIPEDTINQYARTHSPHLIVMGTRGAGQKAQDLIGSVTAEVLDTCRYPIMTIPDTSKSKTGMRLQNVMFFSNFDQQDILAVDSLLRLLPVSPLDICLVKIPTKKFSGDPSQPLQRLKEYCDKHYSDHTFHTDTINIDTAETDFGRIMADNDIDLIVVPNKKKNVFARFFNPGLAHRLLFRSDIPMLVVPV